MRDTWLLSWTVTAMVATSNVMLACSLATGRIELLALAAPIVAGWVAITGWRIWNGV